MLKVFNISPLSFFLSLTLFPPLFLLNFICVLEMGKSKKEVLYSITAQYLFLDSSWKSNKIKRRWDIIIYNIFCLVFISKIFEILKFNSLFQRIAWNQLTDGKTQFYCFATKLFKMLCERLCAGWKFAWTKISRLSLCLNKS